MSRKKGLVLTTTRSKDAVRLVSSPVAGASPPEAISPVEALRSIAMLNKGAGTKPWLIIELNKGEYCTWLLGSSG